MGPGTRGRILRIRKWRMAEVSHLNTGKRWFEMCPPNDLWRWLEAESYIKRALQTTDRWEWRHVLQEYVANNVGLIILREGDDPVGALIYEIIDYPIRRHFHIHLFSADKHSEDVWMKELLPSLKDLARKAGCDSITGEGRKGWARLLGGDIVYSFELKLAQEDR